MTNQGFVVSLECLFKNFSEAKGCCIVLQCVSDLSAQYKFNLSAQENLHISEVAYISCTDHECTTFNVYAYDLTSDYSKGVQTWSELDRNLRLSIKCKFKIVCIMFIALISMPFSY